MLACKCPSHLSGIMTLLPHVQELKDLQKDPPTSCSAGEYTVPCVTFLLY